MLPLKNIVPLGQLIRRIDLKTAIIVELHSKGYLDIKCMKAFVLSRKLLTVNRKCRLWSLFFFFGGGVPNHLNWVSIQLFFVCFYVFYILFQSGSIKKNPFLSKGKRTKFNRCEIYRLISNTFRIQLTIHFYSTFFTGPSELSLCT